MGAGGHRVAAPRHSRLGRVCIVVSVVLAGMGSAYATTGGGCVNSPENPTAVLGLLGLAAAAYPWLKSRIPKRRRGVGKNQESSETTE